MSTKLETATQFHADHRHWQSDIACWNDDIESWRSEHSHAIVQLQAALRQINEHGQCVNDHADSIASLESGLEHHEKSLAADLQNESTAGLDKTQCEHHQREADLHARQRAAHERMKKHHHQAMAKVAMVASALEEAC
ncbi:hypothetical protein [Rubripirellula reticaptiva]|uniref:Uncharacterized protein n=1 Tax=Rubripirellula reticaptiva TaxID=2528013 RepID=A0A5C6EI14_9BACT|nr:hypothetical protein [Rubripirellula reticaptiva]TWU46879.1 hypothetical protein Poly59_58520 [Rubripirellula reticaptiva]